MDQFRPRFLGQVALMSRRSLGTKMIDPELSPEGQAGCTLLGFQRLEPSLTPDQELQVKVEQAKASGLQIIEKSSSRPRSSFAPPGTVTTADMVPGTELWACPATYQPAPTLIQCKPGSMDCGPGTAQPPPATPGQASPPVQPLPLAPSDKPDLVPVAAGAGVVAILAALIGGAFGK
jgi:hypothetical protein